jgi:hypothetical protein
MQGTSLRRQSRKRSLSAVIQPTLALAIGCLSSYAFLAVQAEPQRWRGRCEPVFAAREGSAAPLTTAETVSSVPNRERRMEIVTYRDAVAAPGRRSSRCTRRTSPEGRSR